MQKITKYKADDDLEFLDAIDCAEHEDNCRQAERIMQMLPPVPEGSDFTNGSGYLQHDRDLLLKTRNRFLEFSKRYTTAKYIQQTIDMGFDAHPSWAGRILGDVLPASIRKHWYRFETISSDCREWGQPYYANHPKEGTQKQLN